MDIEAELLKSTDKEELERLIEEKIQSFHGLLTKEVLSGASLLLPAMGLGTAGGIWLSRRVSQARFQRVVILILLVTGVVAVLAGLDLL